MKLFNANEDILKFKEKKSPDTNKNRFRYSYTNTQEQSEDYHLKVTTAWCALH